MAMAIVAVVVFVVGLGTATPAAALTNCNAGTSIDAEEQAFLGIINQHRAQNGLPPLVISESLTRAATWKSQDLGANNYFAHDDLYAGRSWSTRIRDCGYLFNTWLGENLAAGNSTAAGSFDQWRNSPGHNANMLSDNFVAIGIARAYDADSTYGWYWTTDFGGAVEGGFGDVSCNNIVDPIDAALILQRYAGLTSSLPCAENGDVNGDLSVNSTDALLILQFHAGMVAGLPV